MVTLQDSVMVDESRMVAWLDNINLSSRSIRKMTMEMGIRPHKPVNRSFRWFDFTYKEESFSILSDRDDVLLFAVNNDCPENLFDELIGYLQVRSST